MTDTLTNRDAAGIYEDIRLDLTTLGLTSRELAAWTLENLEWLEKAFEEQGWPRDFALIDLLILHASAELELDYDELHMKWITAPF